MASRSIRPPRSAILLAALLVGAASQPAAAQTPTVNLTPSQFPGVLEGPVRIGPMTLLNGTQVRYRVRVFPVLLGQRRDGGIFVRDGRAARSRAGRTLATDVRSFDFPPGLARSVLASVKAVPRTGSFYGGVLFQATPRRTAGSGEQITSILQLNASVLLDPAARRRRVRLSAGRARAESARGKRLLVLVPVTNRGNGYERLRGRIAVRDSRGAVVSRARIKRLRILPGATVDLPATIAGRLPAGSYELAVSLSGGGKALNASGSMRLFGVSEVATRTARLTKLGTPTAYKGEAIEVKGEFRNTGNVGYAPVAEVQVRSVKAGAPGKVAARRRMDVDRADPGATGEMAAKLDLPGSASVYEITVRLLARDRVIDQRSVAVTPTDKPPVLTRAKNWVTDNALVIVGLLLVVLGAGAAAGTRYVRRLKAAARAD